MRRQAASFVRFAIVGVCSNAALYLAYIGLSLAGMGHKTAMTVTFVLGILVTFALNRSWSFQSSRPAAGAFVRYAATYLFGYAVNMLALVLLVDVAGFPHQLVQALMVVLVAVLMFVLQRRWVFDDASASALADSTRSTR
jgi:putative flippase GtrA